MTRPWPLAHELEDFGRGIEAVVRGVDDGRGNGVVRLAMFAVAVNRKRRRSPLLRVVNFGCHGTVDYG